jgi:hypothetical protein
MASKSQLLPVDAWSATSVTEKRLEELVRDGLLRPKTSRSQPEWRAPSPDHQEPAPPEGYVVSFVCFHERGFGVPASPIMRMLLHYYKVELHHLAPSAISQAAIFTAVYEGYLGMDPQWNLWLHLFRAEFFTKKAEEQGARCAVHAGSCVLQVRSNCSDQYIPVQLISSNSGLHDGWFYHRNDEGQLPKYTDRVLVAREENWSYSVVDVEKPKLDLLLVALWKLRQRGLTAGMVAAAFHRRRVMPLTLRRLRLGQMMPEAPLEGSRMSHESLLLDEIARRARRMVGNFKPEDVDRVPMRPTQGFEPLVRVAVNVFRGYFVLILLVSGRLARLGRATTLGVSAEEGEGRRQKASDPQDQGAGGAEEASTPAEP